MELLKLTIKNFKGVRDLIIEANGKNVTISGDNATGKTTVFDACTWLLFGKDSQNKADFEIKTLDPSGKAINFLDHEVEGVFSINGKELTLRKVYAEKWTRKHGAAQRTFEGHTTSYFINGVSKSKNEYAAKISSIIDENIFKLITNPMYFNDNEAMKTKNKPGWKVRRDIVLEVCGGDISDGDVLATDKELSKLAEIVPEGRTIDEHKEVVKASQSKINEELKKIPVRIDEATRGLPDISHIDQKALATDIYKLWADIDYKREELARVESGGEIAEKRKRLAEIERELIQMESQRKLASDNKVDEKRGLLSKANWKISDIKADIAGIKKRTESIATDAARLESRIVTRRGLWQEVNLRTFEYEQDTICPTCKQALPEERLQEDREKAAAEFNRAKSESLEQVSAEGKDLKAKFEELRAENVTLVNELALDVKKLTDAEDEAATIQQEIDTITSMINPITEDLTHQKKTQEKEKIQEAITQLQTDNQAAVDTVRREIAALNETLEALEGMAQKVKLHEQGQARIEELKSQEKTLAAEYEKLEAELYLTEQFVRTKVNLLEQKINSRFKLARFKLFDVQVNGGLQECCETLYGGVPHGGGLNYGHKIIVGMDIIRTLSEHYGVTAPIFVDNAESVTTLPEMDAQVIRLVKPEITDENREKYSRLVVEIEREAA